MCYAAVKRCQNRNERCLTEGVQLYILPHMSRDVQPGSHQQRMPAIANRLALPDWRRLGHHIVFGAGAVALAGTALGAGYWGYAKLTGPQAGYLQQYDPPIDTFPEQKNSVTVYNWNIENKSLNKHPEIVRQIAGFATKKADAILLQEVTGQDVPRLARALSSYSIRHVVADDDQDRARGGLGILIATRNPQHEVSSRQLSGTSTVETSSRIITGIRKERPTTLAALKHVVSASWEESRAILSVTSDAYSHNTKRPIQYMTTHISSRKQRDITNEHSPHRKQFDEVKAFVKDELEEDMPTILCADFNTGAYDVHTTFADLGMLTADPDRATTASGLKIDRCVYYHANTLGLGVTEVLDTTGSDHQAMRTRWRLTTPKE